MQKQKEDSIAKAKEDTEKKVAITEETRVDVSLRLSKDQIEFKYNPKEGETKIVEVYCNYNDWIIVDSPSWVTVSISVDHKKFLVSATRNTTGEKRAGIISIKCGKKTVPLIVNQKKPNKLESLRDKVTEK